MVITNLEQNGLSCFHSLVTKVLDRDTSPRLLDCQITPWMSEIKHYDAVVQKDHVIAHQN